jgi:hypothetical protein
MDNQTVVNAVKNQTRIRKQWETMMNRCISFLKANTNSTIAWVNRAGNHVAHEVAKWTEQEPNRDWPNSVPMCITTPHILKNMVLL